MNHIQCDFCGAPAFKTNGNSELICKSRANTGQCKKDKQPLRSNAISRNQPCPCGSGKKYKRCCANKPQATGSGCGAKLADYDIKCAER